MAEEKILVNFIQGVDYLAKTGQYAEEAKVSAEQSAQSAENALTSQYIAQEAAESASQSRTEAAISAANAQAYAISAREDSVGVAEAAQAAVNGANLAAEYAENARGYANQAIASANSAATSAANAATSAESAETSNQQAKEMAKITMDKVAESAIGYPSQEGTLTYNGQVQTPTWDIFYEPQKMIVTGETSGTNAGTYTITMTPKPTYYWWADGSTTPKTQTWKINRAVIEKVPSQSGTLLYDGTPQSPTWNDYDANKMIIGGTTTATNAGIYTATFTPKSNYQWADGTTTAKSVTWEIASEMLEVPSVTGGMQYNGEAQSPAISPYDTGAISASGDLSAIDAGTYTITFSLLTPNSKWKDGTKDDKLVTWRILPKSVAIPSVTNTNKTYNGSVQSPTISSYSSSEITTSGTVSATNAGNYSFTLKLASANYIWNDLTTTDRTFSWSIAKAAGSLTLSKNSVSLGYYALKPSDTVTITRPGDGVITAVSSNTNVVTVSLDGNTLTLTGVTSVNLGTATVTVSVAEGTNYLAPASKTITVTVDFVLRELNDAPWSQIQEVVRAGKASDYWDIGDRKEVTLNGTIRGRTLTDYKWYCYVIDLDHYDDEANKNTMHFQFGFNALTDGVHTALVQNYDTSGGTPTGTGFCMNSTQTNKDGWESSLMRTVTIPEFKNCLPSDLTAVLKAVVKYTDNVGLGSKVYENVTATLDEIFLLSEYEVFGATTWSNEFESTYQMQYQYFVQGNSKIMFRDNSVEEKAWWWVRSPDRSNGSSWCIVNYDGAAGHTSPNYSRGFAPAFAVG